MADDSTTKDSTVEDIEVGQQQYSGGHHNKMRHIWIPDNGVPGQQQVGEG